MSYQPFYIAGLQSGLVKNPEAFLIPQDAFPTLRNAYIWRDRVKRKLGYELLGRLTRSFLGENIGNSPSDPYNFNVFTVLGISDPDASIIPGTFRAVSGGNIYLEASPPDGTLTGIPGGTGTVDYFTGAIRLEGMGVGVPVLITFTYAPGLPVMGIANRELSSLNLEELIVFDPVYAYRYNTTTNIFEEWISGTTWNGTNSDFFWSISYWQDASNNDLLWTTNFNTGGTPDPIRYSNGTTWTDFAPAVGALCVDDENLGTITNPWNAFGPASTSFTPVKERSVVVTIGEPGLEVISVLTDDGNGNLSTTTAGRSDTGTINYSTGSLSLTINPVLTADAQVHVEYCYLGEFLQQARILIPYKDRLLAFNTYEGTTLGTSIQYPQRLRYSQNGDPTDQFDGWRSDIPGRGGFIDAPTSEHIVSAAFIRDILIVSCERSTWQIRYTGNEILPFVWEKIDTEYGCESTFSMINFDKGVLQIGKDALTVCNGNNVERIDLQIPDEIGEFVSTNDGNKRVHGFRDLNIQLVYWTFNTTPQYEDGSDKVFPNRLLVYNYINNSFSIWDDHFTTLGRWYKDNLLRWQDLDTVNWQEWPHPWNWAFRQQNFPEVIGGNHQGYVEIFNQRTTNDKSLFITGIAGTSFTQITSPNHNLETGQLIILRGIIGRAALNDQTYKIEVVGSNDFRIFSYNFTTQTFENVSSSGTYLGGGEIEVCNNFLIESKQFNIYEAAHRIMLGYIDFFTDSTTNGQFTCQIFVDENNAEPINTTPNALPADTTNFVNSIVPTSAPQFEIQGAAKYWQRFYCQTDGISYQYRLLLSDEQMLTSNIYESNFVLHAMILWMTPGGRLIGG